MTRHHLSLDAMQMTYVLKYMRKLCIPSEKMQSVLDELEYFGFADADRRKDRLYDGIPDGDFPWSYKYSLFDMRAGDIDEDHYERLYTRHFMLQMSHKITQSTAGLRRTCVFYNDEDQGSWTWDPILALRLVSRFRQP
ncbi:hypothetical protein IV203_025541 [Nitzschia inconspicua]|uniref:Uncharacterized protein n=1 Tax=Nitzschia inconspicua TaxID=303405 RepID=A0A9K3P988_9STRA|nr:hypothetical protein IV203_025541 [Nitzschia inconspicua]